jgi:hypothetical protein
MQIERARLLPSYQPAVGELAFQSAALDAMVVAYAAFVIKYFYPTTFKRNLHLDIDGKLDLIEEHLTSDLPQSANAIRQFIGDIRSCKKEYKNLITIFLKMRRDMIPHRIFFEQKFSDRGTLLNLNSMGALATRMVDLAFEFSDWQSLSAAVHLNNRKILRSGQYRMKPLPTPPRTSLQDHDQADKAAIRRTQGGGKRAAFMVE